MALFRKLTIRVLNGHHFSCPCPTKQMKYSVYVRANLLMSVHTTCLPRPWKSLCSMKWQHVLCMLFKLMAYKAKNEKKKTLEKMTFFLHNILHILFFCWCFEKNIYFFPVTLHIPLWNLQHSSFCGLPAKNKRKTFK